LSNQSSNLFFIDLVTSIIIRRNSFIFGRIFSSPSNILAGATVALEEFMRCSSPDQLALELIVAPPVMIQHAWKPPLNDHIKVNWDVAISSKKGCFGLRIVLRNSRGDFMGACCMVQFQRTEACMAEAMIALWAVKFCKDVGFFEVILEGDES
jgi:hypothetical protein